MKVNPLKCQDCGKNYAVVKREHDGKIVCPWCDNPPEEEGDRG